MMLLALTLSFSAFTALSLAMERHQYDLHGKAAASPARRTQWRVLGWALLTVAFALCVADHGWAMGPVLWLGAMTMRRGSRSGCIRTGRVDRTAGDHAAGAGAGGGVAVTAIQAWRGSTEQPSRHGVDPPARQGSAGRWPAPHEPFADLTPLPASGRHYRAYPSRFSSHARWMRVALEIRTDGACGDLAALGEFGDGVLFQLEAAEVVGEVQHATRCQPGHRRPQQLHLFALHVEIIGAGGVEKVGGSQKITSYWPRSPSSQAIASAWTSRCWLPPCPFSKVVVAPLQVGGRQVDAGGAGGTGHGAYTLATPV